MSASFLLSLFLFCSMVRLWPSSSSCCWFFWQTGKGIDAVPADSGCDREYKKRRLCQLHRSARTRRMNRKKANVLKQHLKCCKNTRHGAADRIRTCGLSGRSRTIYPTELQPHIYGKTSQGRFSFEKSLWSIRGQTTGEMPAANKIITNYRVKICRFAAVPQLSENYDRVV